MLLSQPSTLFLRRFFFRGIRSSSTSSTHVTDSFSASSTSAKKNRLVFMGSPQVSSLVLEKLIDVSRTPNSDFEVAAVVTQPASRRQRGKKVMPSPVAQQALDKGFPSDLIFTPVRAGEEGFLSDLKALNPDLCVTAAYGNILPTKFLEIPSHGTVNIHPSLLPLYRGAAPVQRALQDGVKVTGVSLAYTVRALDAGPVISHEKLEIDEYVMAPDLLTKLFGIGTDLLIRELPFIFDGSAKLKAKAQDNSKASLAPKIRAEESWLCFDEEASVLHNKVRAFAGWPGTKARIQMISNNHPNALEVKIISTRFRDRCSSDGNYDEITFSGNALIFPCGRQTVLEVHEIQLPGKKAIGGRDFWNGMQSKKLRKLAQDGESSLQTLCNTPN